MMLSWRMGKTALPPALIAMTLLSGCVDRLADAERMAAPAGLSRSEIATGTFRLTQFSRMRAGGAPVVIYIEGDGLAWRSSSEPSLDPTPRDALGLRLATLDPSPNVVYLARPCQFTKGDARCREAYWTGRRFAEEVVASMNQAIDTVVSRRQAAGIHLVGYSGGGAVSALIAARRDDVLSLRTVAGNLDHNGVNRHNGVSLMPESLNAVDIAPRLAGLPQEHFTGTDDKVVPPFIADGFVRALGSGHCATVTRVQGATHSGGWAGIWPQIVSRLPRCR